MNTAKALQQPSLPILMVVSDVSTPTDSGSDIEFSSVVAVTDNSKSYVVFTVIHSDSGEQEQIRVPLSNPTPNVMQELRKLEGQRFAKPDRTLIPDYTKLGALFAIVTPYEALMFLKQNEMQRGLKLSAVERYRQAHHENQWMFTNQGVGFDVEGRPLDGQHRLFTCVLTGKPLPLLLVYGLDARVREVVDCGVARTPGQVDDMMSGRSDDLPPGTTIQQYTSKIYLVHGGSTNKARLYYKSIKNLFLADLAWLNTYVGANPKHGHAKKKMLNTAAVPSVFLMLHHADPEKTEEFAELVFGQDNPDQNKAVAVTRNYLNDRGDTDDYLDIMYKVLTGFFAFKDNKPITELRALSKKPSNAKKLAELNGAQYRREKFYGLLRQLWSRENPLLPKDAAETLGQDFYGKKG